MKKRSVIFLAGFLLALFFSSSCTFAQEVNSGVFIDNIEKYRFLEPVLVKQEKQFIADDYDVYSVDQAVLFVKKGLLTDIEIVTLSRRIAEGISSLEKYLNISLESLYGENAKIYYVFGDFDISRTYAGYRFNQDPKPIVFLTKVQDIAGSFYLHETAHIFTPNYSSLWLREGLADLLNERLGGYPSFRYKERGIDVVAKARIDSPAIEYIGQNGIPNINRTSPDGVQLRNAHYVLAYSFVKYLETRISFAVLMKIYQDKDANQSILINTGKTVEQWKADWIGYLRSL